MTNDNSVPRATSRNHWLVYVLLLLAIALICLQIWSAFSTSTIARNAARLGTADVTIDVQREKARQEAIGKRIENEIKGTLEALLASGVGALAAALVTIAGAIVALYGYLDTREKEHADRLDALRKEREDRLWTTLNETLGRLVAAEPRERIGGAAGLLPFFAADRSEFHLQALTALIATARAMDERIDVRHSVRIAVEHATRTVDQKVLATVSWQAVKLPAVNLSKRDLKDLDLRDAVLENGRFEGSDLGGADLSAAKMQGAQLQAANLENANLTYLDLAGANLTGAVLRGAKLTGIKVLNVDLDRADLTRIGEGWHGVPWDATRNWRSARFDPDVRRELDDLYGAAAPATKVVMLMWEVPPLVAGGTWTACYHLVRALRRRGADVTVIVPWERYAIDPNPFGNDAALVGLGIAIPDAPRSAYGSYGRATPYWSVSAYSSYSSYGGGAESLAGSLLFRLMGEFALRFRAYVREARFDLVHAHDWVTFDAAEKGAAALGVPWTAHVHSIEADRRPSDGDPLAERIEKAGVRGAASIVVPSEFTRARVLEAYGSDLRIDVVPNVLSDDSVSTADMGRFETRRVVFLGRLTHQKGVDRFARLAAEVSRKRQVQFEVFGDGEDRAVAQQHGLTWRGELPWRERGRAYRGASILVVPSRFEPFGMVVLEAMQRRVPVIYPAKSGAAEVLEAGLKVDPNDGEAMIDAVGRLLDSLELWESTVAAEASEIENYARRGFEDRLMSTWQQAVKHATAT